MDRDQLFFYRLGLLVFAIFWGLMLVGFICGAVQFAVNLFMPTP